MSDFNIARKNMIHNQLMANNIVEDYILKAFEVIPRENFLPVEKRSKAYLDEDIEIIADRYLIEPRIIGNIIKLSKIKKNPYTNIVLPTNIFKQINSEYIFFIIIHNSKEETNQPEYYSLPLLSFDSRGVRGSFT